MNKNCFWYVSSFFLFSFCLQVVEAQYVLSFWKKLALSFKNVLDLQKDSDKFNFYKLLMKPFFTEQFPAYTSVLTISQVQSSKVPVNFVENSKVLENFVQSSKVPGNFVQSSKVPVNFVQSSKVPGNFVQSFKVPGNFVQSSKVPVNFFS